MAENIWISPPKKIGKHEWRIRQFTGQYGPTVTYEFRGPNAPRFYHADEWHDMTRWPTYNGNNGETAGCPKSLKALWEEHRSAIDANKGYQNAQLVMAL